MAVITLNTPDKDIRLEIARLGEIGSWSPAMATIASMMARAIKKQFTEGGMPAAWQPLSEKYAAKKAAAGKSSLPLTWSGHLQNANQPSSGKLHGKGNQ